MRPMKEIVSASLLLLFGFGSQAQICDESVFGDDPDTYGHIICEPNQTTLSWLAVVCPEFPFNLNLNLACPKIIQQPSFGVLQVGMNYTVDAFRIHQVVGLPSGFEINPLNVDIDSLQAWTFDGDNSELFEAACVQISAPVEAIQELAPSSGMTFDTILIHFEFRVLSSQPDISFFAPSGSWSSISTNIGFKSIRLVLPVYSSGLCPLSTDENTSETLSVYPNPAHESVWLQVSTTALGSQPLAIEHVSLQDLVGREVLVVPSGNVGQNIHPLSSDVFNFEIPLSTIPTGLYTISLRSKSGDVLRKRLVVQK